MPKEEKAVYFVSDLHLGVDFEKSSREREALFVQWLRKIKEDASEVYLVGDIFDYWFEYKYVIPKGYTRLFGALADLSDSGIEIHFIKGNHDMWLKEYFLLELGIQVHDGDIHKKFGDKTFYISHSDGVGPGDRKYKMIKTILRNSFFQWLFASIHPRIGLPLMRKMSGTSRSYGSFESTGTNPAQEFAQTLFSSKQSDYYICGHQHEACIKKYPNGTYCNLGDWITEYTYARWNGTELTLKKHMD